MTILHELAALSGDAVNVIRNILTDETSSPSIKLRAAKLVLEAVSAIDDDGDDPDARSASVPVSRTASAVRNPHVPSPAPEPAAAEMSANRPVRSTKIGRNDYCPCGSGLKYKKCCLNKPRQAEAPPALAMCA